VLIEWIVQRGEQNTFSVTPMVLITFLLPAAI
jgi:hypothetical protein